MRDNGEALEKLRRDLSEVRDDVRWLRDQSFNRKENRWRSYCFRGRDRFLDFLSASLTTWRARSNSLTVGFVPVNNSTFLTASPST